MTNDLYNAILKTADKNLSFTKRAKLLKTKNRTLASIKRVLLNIVLGIARSGGNYLPLQNKTIINDSSHNIKIDYIRILGIKKDFINNIKYIKVPYLLSYNNNAYKIFVKKFPKSNAIRQNKNGEFELSPSISLNIFASDLYNLFSNSKNTEATTKALII
jgi:hypothetical protein